MPPRNSNCRCNNRYFGCGDGRRPTCRFLRLQPQNVQRKKWHSHPGMGLCIEGSCRQINSSGGKTSRTTTSRTIPCKQASVGLLDHQKAKPNNPKTHEFSGTAAAAAAAAAAAVAPVWYLLRGTIVNRTKYC